MPDTADKKYFVLTLPLICGTYERRELEKRFNAGQQLYNAVLKDALRRMDAMLASEDYQAAMALYRKAHNTSDPKKAKAYQKEAKPLFKAARDASGFTKYAVQACYQRHRNAAAHLARHIDSQTAKALATRAFLACEKHLTVKSRGRPRFMRKGALRSLESINNAQGIVFRGGVIQWSTGRKESKLDLRIRFDHHDDGYEAQALQSEPKYCRIVRRTLRGKTRYCVQMIMPGMPPQRKNTQSGAGAVVGLDLGPSEIAVVTDDKAVKTKFCAALDPLIKDRRRIQRKMDRSRRAMNPEHYDAKGRIRKKRGVGWKQSNRYKKMRAELAEAARRIAETRKTLHGELVNDIVREGNVVKTEKLSYKAWQRNKHFARSVRDRAPGMFILRLKQRLGAVGGVLEEIDPFATKLSQTCQCGSVAKKELSQRVHECAACGISADRDAYSAFLARFVESNCLDASRALEAWAGVGSLLARPASGFTNGQMSGTAGQGGDTAESVGRETGHAIPRPIQDSLDPGVERDDRLPDDLSQRGKLNGTVSRNRDSSEGSRC